MPRDAGTRPKTQIFNLLANVAQSVRGERPAAELKDIQARQGLNSIHDR
jgi:hypothetical protein